MYYRGSLKIKMHQYDLFLMPIFSQSKKTYYNIKLCVQRVSKRMNTFEYKIRLTPVILVFKPMNTLPFFEYKNPILSNFCVQFVFIKYQSYSSFEYKMSIKMNTTLQSYYPLGRVLRTLLGGTDFFGQWMCYN